MYLAEKNHESVRDEWERSLFSAQQQGTISALTCVKLFALASHLINLKIIVNKFNSRETWRHKNLILKWRCWRAGGGGCCCVLLVLMAGIFYLFNNSWRSSVMAPPSLWTGGMRGEILNFMALKHCYGKWDESCVTFWRPPGAPFEASSVGMVIARHPIIRVQVFEATDGQQQSKATHNQASFPLPMVWTPRRKKMVVNSRMTTRYLAKLPVYCTVCIELALLLGWGSEKSQVYILTIYLYHTNTKKQRFFLPKRPYHHDEGSAWGENLLSKLKAVIFLSCMCLNKFSFFRTNGAKLFLILEVILWLERP